MPARVGVEMVWMPQPAVVAEAYFTAAEKAKTLGAPTAEAGAIVAQQIDLNFQAEGRPTKWEALTAQTIDLRTRYGFGDGPILQETGNLRRSVTNPPVVSGSGGTAEAQFYDDTGYGQFHLSGTVWMPVRDYTYIDDQALQDIDNVYLDWVTADF